MSSIAERYASVPTLTPDTGKAGGGFYPLQEDNPLTQEDLEIVDQKVATLTKNAIEDAISRLPHDHELAAETRIINGISRRLQPYIRESAEVTLQLKSPEHETHLRNFASFANRAEAGAVVCSDGRNDPFATIAGPGEIKVDRRLAGLPDVRQSTSLPQRPVLNDPDLYANIVNALEDKYMDIDRRELVEFVVAHIISTHPSHGCGDLTGQTRGVGHIPEIGMRLGGLREFRARINGGFSAFNNAAADVGGRGTTFYSIIDHYAQGLIVAPYDVTDLIQKTLSLRQNLTELHDNRTLVMSEMLDETYYDAITELAGKMGQESIDVRNYQNLVRNSILLGNIAIEIALMEEKQGFPNIPESLLTDSDASPTAVRLLQYVLVRNCSMRILSRLRKGNHPLMKHPEQFVRVGSSGAENNTQFVPFIQRTPAGPIRDDDIDGAIKLFGLLETTLVDQDVQLLEEGRVILVTGDFNRNDYATERIADQEHTRAKSNIANNAAAFRIRLGESIETGEVIVVGGSINSHTKEVDEIVSRVHRTEEPDAVSKATETAGRK